MSHIMALVAGEGTAGFRDGAFQSAFFKSPQGLAISSDGTQLFVADSANNRIRVIRLDQDNVVTTLAGLDTPGSQNGPLASASFKQPRGVVCLPGDRLVVNDYGNNVLRLVDMKKGVVTTFAGSAPSTLAEGPADQVSMAGIRDMVYLSTADALFFTQPDQGTVKMLDLKNAQVTTVTSDRELMPHPSALCGVGNILYAADRDLPQVFKSEWAAGVKPVLAPYTNADVKVLGLAQSGDTLYALQASSQVPLKRLLPRVEPVTIVSVWGDVIPDPGKFIPTFTDLKPEDTVGFVSDPTNERKLYFANPSLNVVTSYRDLFQYEPWEERTNA